jgi:hypothetical protein
MNKLKIAVLILFFSIVLGLVALTVKVAEIQCQEQWSKLNAEISWSLDLGCIYKSSVGVWVPVEYYYER